MAMAEVANEVADSVDTFLGSEEVEPGAGWPYTEFMQKWASLKESSPAQVATILTEEYTKSYDGGSNGKADVTFSAFDLSKMAALNAEIAKLSAKIVSLDNPSREKILDASKESQHFYYRDYVDLLDFVDHVRDANIQGMELTRIKGAIQDFVIANKSTADFVKAKGVSIWIPPSESTFSSYEEKYLTLDFNSKTKWANALKYLLQ
ncbi:MAG: clostripain-related cysteine peptidase [Bdellovibrionota bacterium]